MKMKFTLSMDKARVAGRDFDQLILEWSQDVSQQQVLEMSQQWISDQSFLTNHMAGLNRVGESSLTIEPVGEDV
jgi:hypothetical protein